jgi:hypothetical protein
MEPTGNDKTVTKVGEVYQTPEQAEADVKRICTAPERQVRRLQPQLAPQNTPSSAS